MRRLPFLAFSLAVLGNAASPPVNVSLRTSWPAPPFLTEVLYVLLNITALATDLGSLSETVALENSDAFFPLVDRLTDPGVLSSLEDLSPEALYQAVLGISTGNGFSNDATLGMNLALHAATPKIEAFYNYYEDHHSGGPGAECGSWVDWHGQVICDIDTFVRVAGLDTNEPVMKSTQVPFDLRFIHFVTTL